MPTLNGSFGIYDTNTKGSLWGREAPICAGDDKILLTPGVSDDCSPNGYLEAVDPNLQQVNLALTLIYLNESFGQTNCFHWQSYAVHEYGET